MHMHFILTRSFVESYFELVTAYTLLMSSCTCFHTHTLFIIDIFQKTKQFLNAESILKRFGVFVLFFRMSSLQGAQTTGPGDHTSHVIQIYPRLKQVTAQCLTLQVTAAHTTAAVIQHAVATLGLDTQHSYSLLEQKESDGEETLLEHGEHPLDRYRLWPKETHKWHPQSQGYYFILQPWLQEDEAWLEELVEDYDDLCLLPELSEDALLRTLRQRFYKNKIYTYASSILVAVNPFKFLPCYYNPKYVMMYENQPLGKLSPHIFAVANVAYHAMLNRRLDQCIVISGESGSGKTESSSYLVHCLTALSQKRYTSSVVRTLLGAGPVLEVGPPPPPHRHPSVATRPATAVTQLPLSV